jgi:DNA repair and recombination protein RAD54B
MFKDLLNFCDSRKMGLIIPSSHRRKKTAKKHKTFDGDGVLTISGGYGTLQDQCGKELGKTLLSKKLELGDVVSIGQKEVEIDSDLSKTDFIAGRPFLRFGSSSTAATVQKVAPVVPRGANSFKAPLLSTTVFVPTRNSDQPTPRHDPKTEGALVMPRPNIKVPM